MNKPAIAALATVATSVITRRSRKNREAELIAFYEDKINTATQLAYNHGFGDGHGHATHVMKTNALIASIPSN